MMVLAQLFRAAIVFIVIYLPNGLPVLTEACGRYAPNSLTLDFLYSCHLANYVTPTGMHSGVMVAGLLWEEGNSFADPPKVTKASSNAIISSPSRFY